MSSRPLIYSHVDSNADYAAAENEDALNTVHDDVAALQKHHGNNRGSRQPSEDAELQRSLPAVRETERLHRENQRLRQLLRVATDTNAIFLDDATPSAAREMPSETQSAAHRANSQELHAPSHNATDSALKTQTSRHLSRRPARRPRHGTPKFNISLRVSIAGLDINTTIFPEVVLPFDPFYGLPLESSASLLSDEDL